MTEHPEVLVAYKKIKGAQGALSGEDLEKDFDERVLARALKARLAEIEPGSEAAHSYHSLMTGILTFVFYPELICPIKERELHEGRKRVDILFTNAAREGFFFRMQVSAQTRSSHVFVECKNYSDEVGNPELDQLGGRFGHQRGFLGILLCRQVARRDVTRARCRDTAQDGRGYIIVLSDDDVNALLDLIAAGRRDQISGFMQRKYDELVL